MKQLALLALTALSAISANAENCDKLGILLYEDLACTPKTKPPSPCPSSFHCNLSEKNKCIIQGKSYENGDQIAKNSIGLSCSFGCFCSISNNSSSTTCAQGRCAEWGGPPIPENCYHTYTTDVCCATGQNCDNAAAPQNEKVTCEYNGETFKEGQRFAPKDSCHVCVCKKGFSGKLEAPFCIRGGCDAQLRHQKEVQQGCAPLYVKRQGDSDEKVCCPTTWTCPDGTEKIVKSGESSKEVCKFGENSLNLGDGFSKTIEYLYRPMKIKCKCQIPPLLSCFEENN